MRRPRGHTLRTVAVTLVAAGVAILLLTPSPSAAGERGRIVVVPHRSASMVTIPAGRVALGMDADELDHLVRACVAAYPPELADDWCDDRHFLRAANKEPTYRVVVVPKFSIDRHEVTVADYRACVAASACDMTALVAGDERYLESALPMVNVTWQEASDYCSWQGKRLPSEAEWEKAARGTDQRRYPWGNQLRDDGANVGAVEDVALMRLRARTGSSSRRILGPEFMPDAEDGFVAAAPPGSLPWGESPYGAADMAGNVREWTVDYYGAKLDDLPEVAPVRSSPLLRRTDRVVRGGSWQLPLFTARVYFRSFAAPELRATDLGFRCAR